MASAVRRELDVRSRAAATDRALRAAGRDGRRVLAGPFIGEIGYELEYWIPFLRRELHRHGIEPEQVTVMTRGGAALWYRDFAAHALDVLELMTPEEYLPRLEERRGARATSSSSGRAIRPELVALAHERLGDDLTVLHPGLMFARLRGLWFKGQPIEQVWPQLEYRRFDIEPSPVGGLPRQLHCGEGVLQRGAAPTDENRAFFRAAVERLAERVDVVLLSTGLLVDDHEEWAVAHERIHPIEHLLRPEDNLAVQTRIIAGARGLVATYGGFSYLGPCLGIPTLTVYDVEQTVPVHLEILRRAFPDADYRRVRSGELGALDAFAEKRDASP